MREIDCELPLSEKRLPLWREIFWLAEWFTLRSSAVYRGAGVPHGRFEPVLLVPGFLGSDQSLKELSRWLGRVRYRAYASGIGRNADCPDVLLSKLIESVEAASRDSGQRLRVIGHSLGGTLARAAAVRRPDVISQVICLGSPIAGSSVHPLVVQLARAIADRTPAPNARPRAHGDHYHDGTCACDVAETLAMPLSPEVTLASIFSETDGVVDWSSSQVEPPATNIEVKATHLGLPFNVGVYRAIALLLSNQRQDLTAVITSAAV